VQGPELKPSYCQQNKTKTKETQNKNNKQTKNPSLQRENYMRSLEFAPEKKS
jgi:hypothetical protein